MRFLLLLIIFVSASLWAQSPPPWVAKSNENSQLLVAIMVRYGPEEAASLGASGADEQVSAYASDLPERLRKDVAAARDELEKRLGRLDVGAADHLAFTRRIGAQTDL